MHHRAVLLIMGALLPAADIEFAIEDRSLHPVDRRLFGQFLERPFGGEKGPEGFADANGDLPPRIVEALDGMGIPVVRFPAGTEVDYTDWTYLIDRAPGRAEAARGDAHGRNPAQMNTTRFGWHEYLRLAQRLGWETIAVTNILDGLAKRRPLADAALHAAGLVAYLNAPVGAALPQGMPDWPAIRAANGHPEPFRVRYIQLGNEWFMGEFKAAVRAATGDLDAQGLADWYIEVLRAHVAAIRAVDPGIEIIMDADGRAGERVIADPVLRREVRYLAIHTYAPMSTDRQLTRRRVDSPIDDLKASDIAFAELWQAWSAMPGACDASGQNLGFPDWRLDAPRALGYRVAVTEWNWACWGAERLPPALRTHVRRAAGVGAAQFIHGLMRRGDLIDIGIQSIVLGNGWNFAALRGLPDGSLVRSPQGQMTTFYNRHHGRALLASRLTGAAVVPGTLSINWAMAQPAIAQVDALATGGDGRCIAHLVNRGLEPVMVTVRPPAANAGVVIHRMLPCASEDPAAPAWFSEDEMAGAVVDGGCRIELPAMALVAAEFALPGR